MKKLILCMITIITLFWGNDSYSALNLDCSNTGTLYHQNDYYENIYHSWVVDMITINIYESCSYRNKYRRAILDSIMRNPQNDISKIPHASHDMELLQILPIYHPKQWLPTLIQSVEWFQWQYAAMVSQPMKNWLWARELCQGIRLPDQWLNEICWNRYTGWERRSIYFLSQQEPYKSAPQIQFYVYKLGILLVARDQTGFITHWDYERKNIPVTEKQIRFYLWDKWYHP